MSTIATAVPASNIELRRSVYAGSIYRLPATNSSACLIDAVLTMVEATLGEDYRRAQFRLPRQEFVEVMQRLKAAVYKDESLMLLVAQLIKGYGFDPVECAFDPLRIRAVTDGGHEHKDSWAAYTQHRDTWYANPQTQINWWLPLHDVSEQESFSFFPKYFGSPIANSSANFDYQRWSAEVGFGKSARSEQSFYPTISKPMPSGVEHLGFACNKAEIVIFSGAHLHSTNKNSSGKTRFSLDFRLVNLEDHGKGIGAPNADNLSTGSALGEYRRFTP